MLTCRRQRLLSAIPLMAIAVILTRPDRAEAAINFRLCLSNPIRDDETAGAQFDYFKIEIIKTVNNVEIVVGTYVIGGGGARSPQAGASNTLDRIKLTMANPDKARFHLTPPEVNPPTTMDKTIGRGGTCNLSNPAVAGDPEAEFLACECSDVPAISEYGLFALSLVLLIGVAIKFGRRRRVAA